MQPEHARAFALLKTPPETISPSPSPRLQPFCTVGDIPACHPALLKWVLKPIFSETPCIEQENTWGGLSARQRCRGLRLEGTLAERARVV